MARSKITDESWDRAREYFEHGLSLSEIEKKESNLSNIACLGYEEGERVLWGAAQRKGKICNSDLENLVWLGILVYEDPVRETVKAALEECQKAGVKVKVVTSLSPSTG